MKAIVLKGKDMAPEFTEVPDPVPAKGEALVRLHAAALNHRDVWISKGKYAGLRYPVIPGSDGAGVVEAVGGDKDRHWVKKKVIINPSMNWGEDSRVQNKSFRILGMPDDGTFAELIKVPLQYLHEIPEYLSFEEAAALPLAGVTAYRALFTQAALKREEKVLISGIGGGVAQFALKFAKSFDAKVYVTSGSESKIHQAKALGALGGVNYKEEGWAKKLKQDSGPFDVILDSAGGEGFSDFLDLASAGGRIALYGGTQGMINGISPQKIFWKQLSIVGSTMGSPSDFYFMLGLCKTEEIRPEIDKVFPLAEAAQAFAHLESGGQFGKIVLKII